MNVAFTAASSAAQSAPGASPSGAVAKTTVDYQSFLKLLVAQMKNQDPTAPMESTDYVAQLATFSGVEQSIQINSKLEQMMQSSAFAQADAIIGRHVTSADGNTSGVVDEVRLTANGLVAVTEGGKEIAVVAGVRVRAASDDE